MNTLENSCVLASTCKRAGEVGYCNLLCYPYILAHGSNGKGGIWNSTRIPNKYRVLRKKDLGMLQQENPQALVIANTYIDRLVEFVNNGVGLYLYSIPNALNKNGTGTGKTTVATTIGNEYAIARIKEHATGKAPIENLPVLFLRVSEFQNLYNSQFRGTEEHREEASHKYYEFKKTMQECELLIMDDISLRNATEALTNEMYEILDTRSIEQRSVIFTSNVPVEKVGEMLSEQIASRIMGMTELVGFLGKDNRKVF